MSAPFNFIGGLSMKQTQQKEFNGWVIGIIWVNIIFGSIRGGMSSIANMISSPILGCVELGLTIIGAFSLYKILCAKKWGLFMWMAYIFTTAIINDNTDANQGRFYLIGACVTIVIMILILQIRKNGVSAWSIIMDNRPKTTVNEDYRLRGDILSTKKNEIQQDLSSLNNKDEKIDKKIHIEGDGFTLLKTNGMASPTQTIPSIATQSERTNNENGANNQTSTFNTAKFIQNINIKLDKSIMLFVAILVVAIFAFIAVLRGCSKEESIRETTNCNITNDNNVKEENKVYHTTQESFETSSERWDANGCSYSNFDYGFAFKLPSDVTWQLIRGASKHTVVKFVQPDTGITFFVNTQKLNNPNVTDVWDTFKYESDIIPVMIQKIETNTGEIVKSYESKKSTLCGHHAIKFKYSSFLQDDRYDEPLEMTAIDYTIIRKGVLLIVSLKADDSVIAELKEEGADIEDLLKCFSTI